MKYEYIEIGEIHLNDKYYSDEICESLQKAGYNTALIYDGITEQKLRLIKKER